MLQLKKKKKKKQNSTGTKDRQIRSKDELIILPDDAVSTTANRHDGRAVLGGDLKEVAEDVVLQEAAIMGGHDGEFRASRHSRRCLRHGCFLHSSLHGLHKHPNQITKTRR